MTKRPRRSSRLPDTAQPLDQTDPPEVGGYTLLGRLGQGGMGTVYFAKLPSGEPVAVKTMHPHLARIPDVRQRFAREIANAGRVSSPFTPALLHADPAAPVPFLVTPFVAGPTLDAEIAANGPLADDELTQIAVNVLSALVVFHRFGIVHRDVKPSNVILSRTGPRIVDLGISRAVDEAAGLTMTGGRQPGTYPVMAPEQWTGQRPTFAVDVFAWACLVVYCRTGQFPFAGNTELDLRHEILTGTPRLDGLAGALRDHVEQALAKDPADRPTATDLLTDILGLPTRSSDSLNTFRWPVRPSVDLPPSGPPSGATPLGPPPVAQPPVAQPPVARPPVARPPVAQPPVGPPSGPPRVGRPSGGGRGSVPRPGAATPGGAHPIGAHPVGGQSDPAEGDGPRWRLRGASIRGSGPAVVDLRRADAFDWFTVPTTRPRGSSDRGAERGWDRPTVVLAVADGAGQRPRSPGVTELAVSLAVRESRSALAAFGLPSDVTTCSHLLGRIFESVAEEVRLALAGSGAASGGGGGRNAGASAELDAALSIVMLAGPLVGVAAIGDSFTIVRTSDRPRVLDHPRLASGRPGTGPGSVALLAPDAQLRRRVRVVRDEDVTGVLVAGAGLDGQLVIDDGDLVRPYPPTVTDVLQWLGDDFSAANSQVVTDFLASPDVNLGRRDSAVRDHKVMVVAVR